MAVEAKENSRTFDVTFLRQMHAPVHVFVSREIQRAGNCRTAEKSPFVRKQRPDQKRQLANRHDDGAVPPCHRNCFFVRLVNEVIGVIGFENVMMHERVTLERIAKEFHHDGAMHEIAMQRPFEQRAENCSTNYADCAPKNKCCHNNLLATEKGTVEL